MASGLQLLILALFCLDAGAIELLELDSRTVLLHGLELQGRPGELIRTSNLGDTLRLSTDGRNSWLLDRELVPEVIYSWNWIQGNGQSASLHMKKAVVPRPLGLLVLEGAEHDHALVYSVGETSCGEYMTWCDDSGWTLPAEQHYPRKRHYLQFFLDYPVVNVSYRDAVHYCNWLSRREGLGEGYRGLTVQNTDGWRLPTVQEMFWLSRIQHHEPHWERAGSEPSPVARQDPDSLAGAQHVTGNVWEWCENGFGRVTDAMDAESRRYFSPRGTSSRLVFGGCFNTNAQDLRTLYTAFDPSASIGSLGFRTVRWLQPPDSGDLDDILKHNATEQALEGSE
jgi:hypothetical protein